MRSTLARRPQRGRTVQPIRQAVTRRRTIETSNHTVLITGGSTGIGLALAATFHAAGNRVIVVGRNEAALANAAAALPGITTSVADVSIPTDRERLAARFPDVSILVNNAGVQHNMPVSESSPSDIEYELVVNFLAPVLLCRAFLPHLLRQDAAAIVNVSSGLALVPKQSAAIYSRPRRPCTASQKRFAGNLKARASGCSRCFLRWLIQP